MSYCRFENTLRDFTDCLTALQKMKDNPCEDKALSESELYAAQSLMGLAVNAVVFCASIEDMEIDAMEVEDVESAVRWLQTQCKSEIT